LEHLDKQHIPILFELFPELEAWPPSQQEWRILIGMKQ
jgi:hypothetical protein